MRSLLASPPPKPEIFVSKPIAFKVNLDRLSRADLEFYEVDHSSASFEARVFLNNKDANHDTPTNAQSGYVGSLFIFGHGSCFGDVGHCEIKPPLGPYDLRPEHNLVPTFKFLTITEKFREIARTSKELTVTVVPVITSYNDDCPNMENVFQFQKLSLLTYDR